MSEVEEYRPKRKSVKRAALIPYFIHPNGEVDMMFMQPSEDKYGGPDPQLAKGKVDPEDDTVEAAAIREAEEELGLRRENMKDIQFIATVLGNTDLYISEVASKEDFGPFHHETRAVQWLTNDQFKDHGRQLHVDIVELVFQIVSAKHGLF